MKNTLIIKKEFIPDIMVTTLKNPSTGFIMVDIIDNNHSYIINFDPNRRVIEQHKDTIRNIIKNTNIDISSTDTIVEGIIFSSIASSYAKLFNILMDEARARYVDVKNINHKELEGLLRKLQ